MQIFSAMHSQRGILKAHLAHNADDEKGGVKKVKWWSNGFFKILSRKSPSLFFYHITQLFIIRLLIKRRHKRTPLD